MAGMRSGNNLDKWRNYFRTCNSNIFDIIENGIKVAALDSPQEFKSKRDGIAEILYTSNFSNLLKCVECDQEELCTQAAAEKTVEEVSGGHKDGRDDDIGGDHLKAPGKIKTNHPLAEASVNKVENSNLIYKDAEALTAKIDEEAHAFDEVLKIKKILENHENEAGSVVSDSLEKLASLPLTLEIMQATEIGNPVNALRKHASSDHIRNNAGTLVKLWKGMFSDWERAVKALKEGGGTPDFVNPSVVDDKEAAGLPSPPLDDLSSLISYDKSIEICNLLDGLDDEEVYIKKQAAIARPIEPSTVGSGSARSLEQGLENKARADTNNLLKKPRIIKP